MDGNSHDKGGYDYGQTDYCSGDCLALCIKHDRNDSKKPYQYEGSVGLACSKCQNGLLECEGAFGQ
jgi:hypothetical protein